MQLIRNELGYLEAFPKPSDEELRDYYHNKYFGTESGFYTAQYSEDELFNKNIACLESMHFFAEGTSRILDLGCGEGFFLNYFKNAGLEVQGADFTLDGIQHFFPELQKNVRSGNLFSTIDQFISEEEKYHFISCNNVLEHVVDSQQILQKIKKLSQKNTIFRFVVPNDDSYFQKEIVHRKLANDQFWVFYPDHLNYFNVDSFRSILEKMGYQVTSILSDFPIDAFLFNPDSSYKRDPSKGKNCHYAKVAIENTLARESIDKLISFRKGCAEAGIGRNLIAYCTLS